MSELLLLFFIVVGLGAVVRACVQHVRNRSRLKRGLPPIQISLAAKRMNRAFVGSLGSVLFLATFIVILSSFIRPLVAQGEDPDFISRIRFLVSLTFGLPLLLACFCSWLYGAVGIVQIARRHPELRNRPLAVMSYLLQLSVPIFIFISWLLSR